MILVAFHWCFHIWRSCHLFPVSIDLSGRACQRKPWQGGGKALHQLAQPEIIHGLAFGSTGRWTWSQGSGVVCLLLGVARQPLRSVHPFSLFLATSQRSSLVNCLRVLGEVWQKRTSQVAVWKAGEVRLSLCPLLPPWWTIKSKRSLSVLGCASPGKGDMHRMNLFFLPFHYIFSIVSE